MDLLKSLIIISEKAANVARLCRQNPHLFQLLIQQKTADEANPRFIEDFKTLADVLIQEMVKYEIGHKFPELRDSIHGEENNIFSNKLGETIKVEMKHDVNLTADLLQIVLNGDRQAATLLALEVHKEININEINTRTPKEQFNLELNNLGIWIDPIDSTAEYINGVEKLFGNDFSVSGLKCVTVLIGVYDKKTKMPVIGVINQPFVEEVNSKWKGSCIWGVSTPLYKFSSMDENTINSNVICVSSSENGNIKKQLQEKEFRLVEVCGAGYKILTVITGLSDAYVLSKNSTFKWDTCGPQAILRSLGGDLLNYQQAMEKNMSSIEYCENEINTNEKNTCNIGGIIAYRNAAVLKNIIDCLLE